MASPSLHFPRPRTTRASKRMCSTEHYLAEERCRVGGNGPETASTQFPVQWASERNWRYPHWTSDSPYYCSESTPTIKQPPQLWCGWYQWTVLGQSLQWTDKPYGPYNVNLLSSLKATVCQKRFPWPVIALSLILRASLCCTIRYGAAGTRLHGRWALELPNSMRPSAQHRKSPFLPRMLKQAWSDTVAQCFSAFKYVRISTFL